VAAPVGRLHQSVARWNYRSIALPDLCRAAADIGLAAIDLLEESDWATVRPFGLVCSMGYAGGGSIADGLNVKAYHDAIDANFTRLIPRAEAERVQRSRWQSSRDDRSEAIGNCGRLNRVKKVAEDHGVTICVELLNSKIDQGTTRRSHGVRGGEIIRPSVTA
jgi:hydroxypyruvate isomerase